MTDPQEFDPAFAPVFDPERYSRQICLPEVGLAGQAKLARSRVLLVGVGGLGSPIALYLAAAGIGTLGLVDPDVVSHHNLQRQILYSQEHCDQPKVEQAKARLQALNPEIQIRTWQSALYPGNAATITQDFDLIVDGSDNLSTRYLLNDLAVIQRKALVYGSVYRFEGQVASFVPGGPCYRCLYPHPPSQAPNCAEAGVLGVLPGLVGSLQASEVLRLLLDWGPGLQDRLLLIDLKQMAFQRIQMQADPQCPVCGPEASMRSLEDLEAEAYPELLCQQRELHPAEIKTFQPQLLPVDLRSAEEREAHGQVPGSLHLPLEALLENLPSALHTLPPTQALLVYCQRGQRSRQAQQWLRAQGYTQVWGLQGGFQHWQQYHLKLV